MTPITLADLAAQVSALAANAAALANKIAAESAPGQVSVAQTDIDALSAQLEQVSAAVAALLPPPPSADAETPAA